MMQRFLRRGQLIAQQVRRGDGGDVIADLRRWAWSESDACGMRFSRGDVAAPPPARVALHVRPLDESIASAVFDVADLSADDQLYLDRRRAIYDAGFTGGWLAVDDDDRPAYLQWLIPPAEKIRIRSFFGPLFDLPDDTLLVEGAWVPPDFRRLKVMGQGLALVTAAALASHGDEIRHAQCYPAADNRSALLGTRSAGYSVNQLRTERWRLGRCSVTITPADESDFTAFAPKDV